MMAVNREMTKQQSLLNSTQGLMEEETAWGLMQV
jgi:hypothetical protein